MKIKFFNIGFLLDEIPNESSSSIDGMLNRYKQKKKDIKDIDFI